MSSVPKNKCSISPALCGNSTSTNQRVGSLSEHKSHVQTDAGAVAFMELYI